MKTRRAVIVALLCSPLVVKAEIECSTKTNDVHLGESFELTIQYGKSSLILSSKEIWEALMLDKPSTLL